MNWRWNFPVAIIILAFFGISLDQSVAPNQEIVVQFNVHSLNAENTQHTISEITNQLKAIGVSGIQVSEIQDGKLKVAYYSTIDVALIKNLFDNQENIQLEGSSFNHKYGTSKIPFDNDSYTYKLEVVKIKNDFASDLGFCGLPVEVKSGKDQYLNPFISLGNAEINFSFTHCILDVAFENYSFTTQINDTSSHKIPEVRAGPFA